MGRHGYTDTFEGQLNEKDIMNKLYLDEDDYFDPDSFKLDQLDYTIFANNKEAGKCLDNWGHGDNEGRYVYYYALNEETGKRFYSLSKVKKILDNIKKAKEKLEELLIVKTKFYKCPKCGSSINSEHKEFRSCGLHCLVCGHTQNPTAVVSKQLEKVQQEKDKLNKELDIYRKKHGIIHTAVSVISGHS